jgi:hypothetical protein
MDRLEQMISAQRKLQEKLGYDFPAMTVAARVAFIKEMYIAVLSELSEALDETSWKPWTTGEPRLNEESFLSELSDAWQFIANMWFAAHPNATPAELAEDMQVILNAKLIINRRRAESTTYDGVTGKCQGCGRALDDQHTQCRQSAPNSWWCVEQSVTT